MPEAHTKVQDKEQRPEGADVAAPHTLVHRMWVVIRSVMVIRTVHYNCRDVMAPLTGQVDKPGHALSIEGTDAAEIHADKNNTDMRLHERKPRRVQCGFWVGGVRPQGWVAPNKNSSGSSSSSSSSSNNNNNNNNNINRDNTLSPPCKLPG